MAKQELIIDVDRVIASYNKKNPTKRQMDRKTLAETIGVNKQVFSDWKRGKTPKWVYVLIKLMNVGKCDVKDFIIESDEKGGS